MYLWLHTTMLNTNTSKQHQKWDLAFCHFAYLPLGMFVLCLHRGILYCMIIAQIWLWFSGMFNIIFKRRMRQLFTKKSIVLYILHNVVINIPWKNSKSKHLPNACKNWMRNVDEHRSEHSLRVKISSEALEEVNVYLWAADVCKNLHLISLVTREISEILKRCVIFHSHAG